MAGKRITGSAGPTTPCLAPVQENLPNGRIADTVRDGARPGFLDWLGLVKFPIGVMNGLAAVVGYAVCRPLVEPAMVQAAAGVATLAWGAAALNNYQDRALDSCFPRTRRRPLPRKSIPEKSALMAALALMACGLLILGLIRPSLDPACLGLLAVVLYNGVYTPLKSKTVWAIAPGAVCGMMPPLIGWLSAGGSARAGQLLVLMLILGVWQLPHYWLVLLSDPHSYRKAAFPNMLRLFSVRQLQRLLLVWVMAFASMAMLLPVVRAVTNPWLNGLLVLYLAVMILFFGWSVGFGNSGRRRITFLSHYLNSAMGLVLLIVIVDRLILFTGLRIA